NGAGCAWQETRAICDVGIIGNVLDVDVNLVTGADRKRALNGALTELIVDGEVITTSITDNAGFYDLNSNSLNPGASYQIRTTHPNWPDYEVIHDYILRSANPSRMIDVPFSTLDSLEVYIEKVDSVTLKATFAGAATSLSRSFSAYDISDIQAYIFSSALSITENHEVIIESLKRITLGLKLLDDYLQGCIAISDALAKSLYEGGKAVYELTGLLNSTGGLKEKFLEFLNEQVAAGRFARRSVQVAAYHKVLLNIVNRSYDYMKASVIDPYLASFSKSPEDQRYVSQIKAVQFTIEKTLLNADGLQGGIKDFLIEPILSGISAGLTKNIYIDIETSEVIDKVFTNAIQQNGSFEQAVTIANAQKQITFLRDNEAFQLVDNFSANAKNLTDFANFLESVSVALAATGIGAAVAGGMYQGSKVFKGIGLPQLGATLPVMGQRFLAYPNELDGTILRRGGGSPEVYPAGFFDNQLAQLNMYFNTLSTSMDNFKMAFVDASTASVATAYLPLQEQLNNANAFVDNAYYLNAVSESGLMPDTINGTYQTAIDNLGAIKARTLSVDMMTMAYFMDTTNLEIQSDIQLEMDTLQMQQTTLQSNLMNVYQDAQELAFDEMIAVKHVVYPDSLNSESFMVNVTIQNYGPATTDSFQVNFEASENLELLSINGEAAMNSITLAPMALTESKDFQIEVMVLDDQKNMNLFMNFENARSIDATIPFEFINNIIVSSNEELVDRISHYQIFPNPGNIGFTIEGESFDYFELIKQSGQVLARSEQRQIQVKDFTTGIYYVRVVKDDRVEVLKWIVN
ncbi:MAG: T9SS type A sorting domain-containing protein, partial [Bacteroidota bacterium]